MTKTFALLSTIVILTFAAYCSNIPKLMNYQGKLTNSAGVALNGTHNVAFRIYTAPTGGSAIWSETQTVSVTNGLFDVRLGISTPLNLAFDDTYYVELVVNSEVLAPRNMLAVVPYAFRTIYADSFASGAMQVGSMTTNPFFANTSADNQWFGLGLGDGRITFGNAASGNDTVSVLSANFGVNVALPNDAVDVSGYVDATLAYKLGDFPVLKRVPAASNVYVGNGEHVAHSGINSTVVGDSAGMALAGGSENTFIGARAGKNTSSGGGNTATGSEALFANSGGNYNTASGATALRSNTGGSFNVATGFQALRSNTTGNYNVAIGTNAMQNATTSFSNVAIGYQAMLNNINGSENTVAGTNAMNHNSTGFSNAVMGTNAMYNNISGASNAAFGYLALFSNTDGTENVGIGASTLYSNTGGDFNTAIGSNALYYNIGGMTNTGFGAYALFTNTEGFDNVANGSYSLYSVLDGDENVASGKEALYSLSTGNRNVAAGKQAGYTVVSGSGNVFIGYRAGYFELGSNKLYIDNSNTSTPLIYGDFSADSMIFNGNVQITGKLRDSSGDVGTAGQVLSTTVTGTDWVTPAGSGGGTGWNIVGNVETDPATHFCGTIDNASFVIKSRSVQGLRLNANAQNKRTAFVGAGLGVEARGFSTFTIYGAPALFDNGGNSSESFGYSNGLGIDGSSTAYLTTVAEGDLVQIASGPMRSVDYVSSNTSLLTDSPYMVTPDPNSGTLMIYPAAFRVVSRFNDESALLVDYYGNTRIGPIRGYMTEPYRAQLFVQMDDGHHTGNRAAVEGWVPQVATNDTSAGAFFTNEARNDYGSASAVKYGVYGKTSTGSLFGVRTIAKQYGGYFEASAYQAALGSVSVDTSCALYALGTNTLATVTNKFGVFAKTQDAATRNYGGYFEASGGTTNYGIYAKATGATPSAAIYAEGKVAMSVQTVTTSGTLATITPTASAILFSSATAKTLRSFDAGTDGQLIYIINTSGNLTIENDYGTTTTSIITGSGASVTITGDGGATLIYAASRWRIIGINN